jgi:hypothetical protein
LIRDAVTIANDASASLSQKVALFGASAVLTEQDRNRLDDLLVAVEREQGGVAVPYGQTPSLAESSKGENNDTEGADRPFAPAIPVPR